MERRKHYWNGKWGTMARRDILIFQDGWKWMIEARDGGAEGRSRYLELDDEDRVLEVVRGLMSDSDGWRELPPG